MTRSRASHIWSTCKNICSLNLHILADSDSIFRSVPVCCPLVAAAELHFVRDGELLSLCRRCCWNRPFEVESSEMLFFPQVR